MGNEKEDLLKYKDLAERTNLEELKKVRPNGHPYDGISGDCYILAICSLLDLEYEYVYNTLFDEARKFLLQPNDISKIIVPFMNKYGYDFKLYEKGKEEDIGQIIDDHSYADMLIGYGMKNIGGHIIAYKNHTVYDRKSDKYEDKIVLMSIMTMKAKYVFRKRIEEYGHKPV